MSRGPEVVCESSGEGERDQIRSAARGNRQAEQAEPAELQRAQACGETAKAHQGGGFELPRLYTSFTGTRTTAS